MFDRDLEQIPYEQENLPDYKLPFMTAYTMRNTESFKNPHHPPSTESFSEDLQLSMDRDIFLNNAQLIKEAAIQYLKSCLKEYNHDEKIFQESLIFCFQSFGSLANHEENTLQSLIHGNQLLSETQKKELMRNFEEFQEFSGVFNQLKDIFSRQICQELIYIIATLLENKLKKFKTLIHREGQSFLPQIERFWGYENHEEMFKGAWEVYEDVDYEQIKKFAAEGIEEHAIKIYFSKKLNFLTLRNIKCELKQGVSVADKFATLVTHLSSNIFLSLSGIAQREEDGIEIANVLSMNYIEEVDTITDTLSKRIKSDE